MTNKPVPNHHEIILRENDFIVTKTDTKGRLTYCNPIFIEFSGYQESELLGQQHNIVRHPDMPRSVFALLWQTISSGNEFMGYVKNLCKDGSFYWVFATVTPSFNTETKAIIGYFSVRRKPERDKLKHIETLYRDMLNAEKSAGRANATEAGMSVLQNAIQPTGKEYREFIFTF